MRRILSIFLIIFAAMTTMAQNNVITYTAENKLVEVTGKYDSGLHLKAFNASIISHTFANGTGTIIFSGSVTSIGGYAFMNCEDLTTVSIPHSVTSIADYAFFGCKSLTSVAIPYSVTSIGMGAFADCSGLISVTIPNSVTYIGYDAFTGCSSNLVVHVFPDSQERFRAMGPLKGIKIVADASPTSVTKVQPPILALVENSLQLIDANGNKTIDANETCTIRFQVINRGKSPAKQCKVKVQGTGSVASLTYSGKDMPQLEVGATQTIEIPVSAKMDTQDGQVTFSIEVTEPNGFGIDPMTLTVNTRAFDAPLLKVVDYAVSNSTLKKKEPFKLQLLLQNTKHGKAEDVDVTISIPDGVMLWEGESTHHFENLQGGEKKDISIQLVASGNYAASSVPVMVSIHEKYGRFAENRTIDLQLNQQLTSSTSLVLQGEQSNHQGVIQIGTIEHNSTEEINIVTILNTFTLAEQSSVLSLYSNEFGKLVMPDRDESFPYALFRVSLQGDKNHIRLAKQHLMLDMGQLFQTEKTVTSYNNMVLFLVPSNARNIYITCGDGCEKQLIYSGRLGSNKIYDGLIEVK